MKLLQKRPGDRYPTAEALRADLNRYLDGDMTSAERALPVAAAAAGAAVAAAATTVQPAVSGYTGEVASVPVDEDGGDQPKSRTGVFLGVIVVLLVILAGLLFWFANSLSSDKVEVPATIGLPRAEAEKLLTDAGLKVVVTEEPNDKIAADHVISSNPVAQTQVEKGSPVRLVVSSGVAQSEVPDVVTQRQGDAEAAITAAGFTVGTVTYAETSDVDPGVVMSQNPPGRTKAEKGSKVDLQVAKAPGQEAVPDVAGQTLAAAQAALQAAGFRIGGPVEQPSATVAAGRVISTDPAGGSSAKTGSKVTITVSSGVEQVAVPNVVGQTETNATATLQARGSTSTRPPRRCRSVTRTSVVS